MMKYMKGFKYQLKETFHLKVKFKPVETLVTDFVVFRTDHSLTIYKGYAWDGASGPTIDDKTNVLPSLVHDAFYELMRKGLLSLMYRKEVDELFREMCVERGMWSIRASFYFWAVRKFGKYTSREQDKRIVHTAP